MSRSAFEPTTELPQSPAPAAGVLAPPHDGERLTGPAPEPPAAYRDGAAADPVPESHRAPSWLDRLGPVGLAAIIGAMLVVFGLSAVVVSMLAGGSPGAHTVTEAPTPVDPPTEPLLPSTPGPSASAKPSASASPSPSTSASRSPSAKPSPSTAVSITGNAREEAVVVALINRERARAGCRQAVRMDDRLRAAARTHSTDMATRNFFSHTGSDGSSPEQRMRRAGYNQPVSENLARGPGTAQDVMRSWMASPGHRRNILDCGARAVGVGLVIRNGSDPFWTQDFGR